MNHFQSVPSLPGCEPLAITAGGPKGKRGGAKAKAKGKAKERDDSPPRKRIRGDEELLQLELKRKLRKKNWGSAFL